MRLAHSLAAAILLASCTAAFPADIYVVRDVVSPGKDFPGYAIPKFTKLVIDGKSDEWQIPESPDTIRMEGLSINVFGELAPHPSTDSSPSPTAQVAWTGKGLAVLFKVHDTTPHESANIATMHDGDSVEMFISNSTNAKQFYQVTIAPGIDPEQGGKMRVNVTDYRADKAEEIKIEAAATKTADGYIVEALLPLAPIQDQPDVGVKLGLQLHVNDKIAAGQLAQYRWRPTYRAWRGAEYHQPIVLAGEKPRLGAEVLLTSLVSVNADYQNFRRLRLRLNTPLGGPHTLKVTDEKGSELGSVRNPGGRTFIDLPFPEKPYGPLTVWIDSMPQTVLIPEPPPTRASALDSIKTVFKPFAFSGSALPGVDVDDPILAEDILGKYKLSVRYFDASLNETKTAEKPGRYLALVHLESETYKLADDRIFTLYRMPEEMKSWRDINVKLSTVEFPKEFGIPNDVATEQAQVSADLFKDLLRNDFPKTPASAIALAGLAETKAGSGPMVWRTNPASLHGNFDYLLRKKLGILQPYQYLEHLPPDYNEEKKKSEKFPLIIFLHGSGERGNVLDLVKTTGFPEYLETHKDFPAIVLSPQCPFGQQWRPQLVNDLVDQAVKKYRVDPDRIYMTGLSMGGYGTWAYAAWYPERLAAILPICGIGDAKDMTRLKNVPTWAFHGDVDDQVPVGPDIAGCEALKAAGGNVKLTIYPGVGHFSWTQTYNNPDIYTWLLAQKRK